MSRLAQQRSIDDEEPITFAKLRSVLSGIFISFILPTFEFVFVGFLVFVWIGEKANLIILSDEEKMLRTVMTCIVILLKIIELVV